MSFDIFDAVDSLNRYVESPQEIRSKFDFITYFKGALVLRMFQEAFTESTWAKGVSYYLREMEYQSASPEDLFRGLQQAYQEDFPDNDIDVGALMNIWLNFPGYPVVTVSRNNGNMVLTQEGFRTSHEELFSIPINYATKSNPEFNNTIVDFWLTTRDLEILPENATKLWDDDDWIILNLRDTGYYLTNYEDDLWHLISGALLEDHEAIHFLNRGTLFADFHRFLTEDFEIRSRNFLEMMQYLPNETHPHVWIRAGPGCMKLEQRLRGTHLHQFYLSFLENIMTSVYNDIPFTDRAAIDTVNRLSCTTGVQACLDDSLNILVEVMEFGSTSYEFDFRCNGFLTANETIWRHFFELATDSTDERLEDLQSLVCTLNPELIRFYLDQTLVENSLTLIERHAMLVSAAGQSRMSFDATIDFIEEKYEDINLK